ncbi:MAG: CoA-binding protein [Nitrospirota bacterium]|nr:CoA-binding protein [Nitrospirota bacterium]
MTDASGANSIKSSPETIRRIFDECRTIAVVGLSANPTRPAYDVASSMQQQGYRIVPVNPLEMPVLGQTAYASLAAVPGRVDLVSVFRKSEEAGGVVDQAIKVGAKAVWLQEGVIDEDAAQRAQRAGLLVVMDRCWKKEWKKRTSE